MKNVLVSVTDKGELAQLLPLASAGWRFLSTGGTAKELTRLGIEVTEVSDYTGFPEMMGGRLKTLHPKVHGGLLASRFEPEHMEVAEAHGIEMIDLLVVNLYAFEATVAKPGCTREDAIETIDIGGPAMVRSAAKNWKSVAVVVHPGNYQEVVNEILETGSVSEFLRFRLATQAFRAITNYDQAISNYFEKELSQMYESRKG